MEWIPFEQFQYDIPKYSTPSQDKAIRKAYMNVVGQIKANFATGKEWLLAPALAKRIECIPWKGKSINEIVYILFWAWEKKVYLNPDFKNFLYDYLNDCYNIAGSALYIKNWIKRHNLITHTEWEVLKKKKGSLKAATFLTLFNMKPFSQITDIDLDATPLVYCHGMTKKLINDIRIKLGYTNKIIKRTRDDNWTKLFSHPLWGGMFKEFYNYLIRAQAKKNYLKHISGDLLILLEYLESRSLSDCSRFNGEDFESFTNYIINDKGRMVSSVSSSIGKYRKFFAWGRNESSFFPKELDFPESYWTSLHREAKEYSKNSDGRAFAHEGIADEIVIAIKKYKPANELDQLCLYFWMIIVSCPARFSFVRNLEAENAIQPLPNEPNAYGIYSRNADKSGNKGGQFPILDPMGIDAIFALQTRAKIGKFKPLFNEKNKRSYVHLFQLSDSPWVLDANMIWGFFDSNIKPEVSSVLELEKKFIGGAHGFRHHILTEIVKRTGSIDVAQIAGGHSHITMTTTYIKSKHAKNALLYRAIDKYEQGELTGKFYLRLIEALTTDDPTTELLRDLTKEMTMDEFIKKNGRRTEMGFCFDEEGTCRHYLKCWNCPSFLMTKEEIEGAVSFLRQLISDFIVFKKESNDFNYENPISQSKLTAIALIKERLMDLKISEEELSYLIFDQQMVRSEIQL